MLKNIFISSFNFKDSLKIIFKFVCLLIILNLILTFAFNKIKPSILRYSFWKYQNDLIDNKIHIPNSKILALGSSQFIFGFIPNLIPNSVSLSAPNASSIENYYMFKRYLKKHQPPKILVLSPRYVYKRYKLNFWKIIDFIDYRLDELWEIYQTGRQVNSYPTNDKNAFKFLLKSLARRLNLMHLNIFYLQRFVVSKSRFVNAQGLYNILEKNRGSITRAELVKNIYKGKLFERRVHEEKALHNFYEFLSGDFKPFILHDVYLEKLVDLANESGIIVVFIAPPISPIRLKYASPSYVKDFNEHMKKIICSNIKNKCWDNLSMLTAEDFFDPYHLTYNGAKKYTLAVKAFLQELSEN